MPLANSHLTAPSQTEGSLWGLGLAAFFYPMITVGSVLLTYQQASSFELILFLISFYVGTLSGILFFEYVEKCIAAAPHTAGLWGARLAIGISLIAFVNPVTLYFFPWLHTGYWFLLSQAFLWSFLWPLMYRLFFFATAPSAQPSSLAAAKAVGHTVWAFAIPLLLTEPSSTYDILHSRPYFLLHCIRAIMALGFSYMVWKIYGHFVFFQERARATEKTDQADTLKKAGGQLHNNRWGIILFIAFIFAILCLLDGFVHFVINPRVASHGTYPEYRHIIAGILLIFLAFLIHRRGTVLIKYTFCLSVLTTAVALWFLTMPSGAWLQSSLSLLAFVAYRAVLFLGILLVGAQSPKGSWPVLAGTTIFLFTTPSLVLGSLAREYLAPLAPFSPTIPLFFLVLLCPFFLWRLWGLLPHDSVGYPKKTEAAASIESFVYTYKLSPREREVLDLLVRGFSTGTMADQLGLKENSVRFYIRTLLKKTGMNSRVELITAVVNSRSQEPETPPRSE